MMKVFIAVSLCLFAIWIGTSDAAYARVKPAALHVAVGEDADFTCKIHDKEKGDKFLYWLTPNGTHLPDGDPHTVVTDNGTMLKIVKAERSEAGTYYCVYKDGASGVRRKAAKLTVEDKLSIDAPSTQYIVIGHTSRLRCRAEGKGLIGISYHWRYEGIPESKDKVESNGDLKLSHPKKSDGGNYTCRVETLIQEAKKKIDVKTISESDLAKPPTKCTLTPKFAIMDVCCTLPAGDLKNMTKYEIKYWATDHPFNVTKKVIVSKTFKCPTTITDLKDGTKYKVKVAIANKYGYGNESKVYEATTTRADCPREPLDVIVHVNYTHAEVSWKPPSNDGGFPVTEYRIRYRVNNTHEFYKEEHNVTSPTTIHDLYPHTEYEFKVSAKNKKCWGPSYETVEETLKLAAPSPPTQLYLRSTDHTIKVSWKKPANNHGRPVTEYRLEYRKKDGFWHKKEHAKSPYTIKDLDYDKHYEIRVYAKNEEGWSKAANSTTVTLVINPPTAPRNMTVSHIDYNSMKVSWNKPINDNGGKIKHYTVQYREYKSKAPFKPWLDEHVDANTTSLVVKKLNASTKYTVHVGAENVAGITYTALKNIDTTGAPLSGGAIAGIVIGSIIGALVLADIILYFALDTGVTKTVVGKVQQSQSGYEKAPETAE